MLTWIAEDSCKTSVLLVLTVSDLVILVSNIMYWKTSNLQTHKLLHEFRLRHYTAQSMTLAVQSQETLETLEEWVRESFARVPNNGLQAESFADSGNPFSGKISYSKSLCLVIT